MSNDIKAFRANIEAIIEQYEQLAAENARLKNENALLKAKISMLQKTQEKSQIPQSYNQNDIISKQARRRLKTRVQVNWVPIQYDFSDSVLCVHRYGDTLAFGTADANVILFNTNFDSKPNKKSSDSFINNDGYSGLSYNSPQVVVPFAQYRGHSGAINCITADPTTELFASCSGDGTAHVWSCLLNNSIFTPQQRHLSTDSDNSSSITNIKSNLILSHHTGPVISASWLTNGHLITGSTDSTVCIWDVAHSQNFTHVEKVPAPVTCTDSPQCVIPISNSNKSSSISSNITLMNLKSSNSSSMSPIIGYAVGLSNGEVQFFDQRINGRVMSISHSKGQIISCKFGSFDINSVNNNSFAGSAFDTPRSGANGTTINSYNSTNKSSQSGSSSGKKKKKRPSSINLLYDGDGTLNASLNTKTTSKAKTNKNNYIPVNSGISVISNSSLTNLTDLNSNRNNFSPSIDDSNILDNNNNDSNNSPFFSFVSAGSDKSVRIWDLRMPQDYVRSFDVDHVPTQMDICGPYISVSTEVSNPRFIDIARNVIMPLGSPPFSYTISSCAFASDDASKVVMASWDGTAAIMKFEMNTV